MSDCIFCKIIAKEIPSTPIYEDEDVYAFLDIRPINPGHVLIVPKVHSVGLNDTSPEVLTRTVVAMQKVAQAVQRGLGAEGFNIHQNNGAIAGQEVSHLHFHIIPRHAGDGYTHWHGTPYISPEEARMIAEKIRQSF